jgi:hypothetical protein
LATIVTKDALAFDVQVKTEHWGKPRQRTKENPCGRNLPTRQSVTVIAETLVDAVNTVAAQFGADKVLNVYQLNYHRMTDEFGDDEPTMPTAEQEIA